MNTIEDLAAEVDLTLVEPVERVFDVLHCPPQRDELLRKMAGPEGNKSFESVLQKVINTFYVTDKQ